MGARWDSICIKFFFEFWFLLGLSSFWSSVVSNELLVEDLRDGLVPLGHSKMGMQVIGM